MSRIETRNTNSLINAQQNAEASRSSVAGAAASSAARSIWQVQSKLSGNRKIRSKKAKQLVSASDISETDLQPLMGKRRDEMIGDLTRMLVSIHEYDGESGEDETSRLCKMMLGEHVRRLTLIKGTQIVSDGLRGSA